MKDRMRLTAVLLGGLLALAVLAPVTASASDEELLKLVRAGMYHMYTSITACKGSVHLVATRPATEPGAQEQPIWEKELSVAFDGTRLRMSGTALSAAAVNYQELFDGEKTTEFTDGGTGVASARIEAGETGIGSGDFSVFVDPRSIGGRPLKTLEPETDNILQGTAEARTKGKVWVDLDKGCAVPKLYVWYVPGSKEAPVLMREESVELRQYSDALWVPARYTRIDYKPDGTVEKKVIGTYDPEFKINVPIGEEDLKLTLPSGTSVYDFRIGAPYTVP